MNNILHNNFKQILRNKNLTFSYTFHHFDESFLASDLGDLYHSLSSLYQSSFSDIIFELKDKYDYDRDLHG